MRSRSTVSGWKRAVGAALIAGFLPLATVSCFGKFELTRKVYTFNQGVDPDKWVQWLVFVLLSIFPYPAAVTIDTLFANSLEFWTGENPITTAGETRTAVGPEGQVVATTLRADGALDVTVTEADGTIHYLVLVRERDAVAAYDAEGNLLARAGNVDGEPVFQVAPPR